MRLVIGGPTLATVPASFALDLVRLYAYTEKYGPWASVTVGLIGATYVHVGREAFLETAITQCDATHVLWLDTDMAFPEDTAVRLARHDRPVVACNCVMRDPRLIFTAQRDGKRIETKPDSTGLEPVDTVGLAVMLMRTEVVADLPRPWFQHGRNETGGDIGEDLMFCRSLRTAGHQILIDHDLSLEIGHIGHHTYRPARQVAVPV
jgi:hypothetical protein